MKAGDGQPPSRAFSREYRLLRPRDFAHVFSAARRSSDRFFTVLATPSVLESKKVPRLGMAIAKKQLRRAVDRNRVKRLVREHFRNTVIPEGRIPLDYVVMARAAILQEDNAVLREALARHFRRLQDRFGGGNDTDKLVP